MYILREKYEEFPVNYTYKDSDEFWKFILLNGYYRRVKLINIRTLDEGREFEYGFFPRRLFEIRFKNDSLWVSENKHIINIDVGPRFIKSIRTGIDPVDRNSSFIKTKNFDIFIDFAGYK